MFLLGAWLLSTPSELSGGQKHHKIDYMDFRKVSTQSELESHVMSVSMYLALFAGLAYLTYSGVPNKRTAPIPPIESTGWLILQH